MSAALDVSRFSLEGRVALVTGGASGIGRGAVEALLSRGAQVTILDRHEQQLADARSTFGPDALADTVRADVTQAADVDAAVAEVVARHGRLDIVVTAAGIQRYGDAVTTTESLWTEVMDVNLTGAFRVVHAALPHLRESPAGAIVLVSSAQAFVAQGNATAYGTSKGALNAFARTLAIDEAIHGIRANAVCPGSVDTPMLRASARSFSDGTDAGEQRLVEQWGRLHPLGRVATPREVGEAVAFLVSDQASFITGASVPVDGGLVASVAVSVSEPTE